MRVAHATPWVEAVFHVLAHVDVGAVPASCHSPAWIAWAAARFGPAGARPLGEDAQVLADAAPTHDALARLHAVAWLFDSPDAARRASARDLADLDDRDVADPTALGAAKRVGAAAEVLRAAAELELPLVSGLPPADFDEAALEASLERVTPAADVLPAFTVVVARPLGLRGRVYAGSIYVGVPGVAGATLEHVAWQAAHEATVAWVESRIRRTDGAAHDDIEREAIATLRSRARGAGLADDHARWLAHLDLSVLGPIPDVPHGSE